MRRSRRAQLLAIALMVGVLLGFAGEISSNLVDRLPKSRGGLLISTSFYQLPGFELRSHSDQRHQVSAG